MDYDWLYARLSPLYCHDNGRNGTDPVVRVKMVLLQHLFGIASLRETHRRIMDTLSSRWFLGYGLLDDIPHFATVSYAFCKRFPPELSSEIFEHILNETLNSRVVDLSMIFIDGTHIKASANKEKFQTDASPCCPTPNTAETRISISPGSTATTPKVIPINARKAVFCGTRPQIKRGSEPTENRPQALRALPASTSVRSQ